MRTGNISLVNKKGGRQQMSVDAKHRFPRQALLCVFLSLSLGAFLKSCNRKILQTCESLTKG